MKTSLSLITFFVLLLFNVSTTLPAIFQQIDDTNDAAAADIAAAEADYLDKFYGENSGASEPKNVNPTNAPSTTTMSPVQAQPEPESGSTENDIPIYQSGLVPEDGKELFVRANRYNV